MRITLKPPIKSKGQSILVKNDIMQSFYAPHHYHSDYEIIYIKRSYGIRIIGNNISNYKAGEVLVLGPGLPHYHVVGQSPEKDKNNTIETIAVLFPESMFEVNSQFPELGCLKQLLEKLKYGIELKGHTKVQVRNILEQMTLNPSLGNFTAIFRIMELIAAKESSFSLLSTVKYDNKRVYNKKTRYIFDFISNNYQNRIRVEQLSKECNLSKAGFCNFFKNETGVTFSYYINMLRISKACELLAVSSKTISEIAFEVGYDNLSYFNRMFKQMKNITPKEFRRQMNA